MPNRYANLTPSAKISQEYTKITEGFDKVQQEMDQRIAKDNDLQSQINAHKNDTKAHPAEHITYSGKVSGASNIKQAADRLNDRIDNIVAQGGSDNTEVVDARQSEVKSITYPVLDARLEAIEQDVLDIMQPEYSSPTEVTAPVIALPESALSGELRARVKGNTSTAPIRIKTVGKNKFDGVLEPGNINDQTGQNSSGTTFLRSRHYIPVRPNTYYNLKFVGFPDITNDRLFYYDKDKRYIGYKNQWSAHANITPENCYYVRFTTNLSTYPTITTETPVMFEEGLEYTEYEPYTETVAYLPSVNPVFTNLDMLQSYSKGTIYIEPVVKVTKAYAGGINVDLPIQSIESIAKLDGETLTPVNVSAATIAQDKLSLTISGAEDGDVYEIIYAYPSELMTLPTLEYSYPINVAGQIDSNTRQIAKMDRRVEDWIRYQNAVNLLFDLRITALEP